jgi:hypothetical protein
MVKLPHTDLKCRANVQFKHEAGVENRRRATKDMIHRFNAERESNKLIIANCLQNSKLGAMRELKHSTGDNWYLPLESQYQDLYQYNNQVAHTEFYSHSK